MHYLNALLAALSGIMLFSLSSSFPRAKLSSSHSPLLRCSITTLSTPAQLPIIPSGLLAVYKPQNWTSSDVVAKIKYILQKGGQMQAGGRKCRVKVGHGGTLDPLAQGVLVLGIGDGTKLMGDYLSGSKEYISTCRLGTETDTLDSVGTTTESAPFSHITWQILESSLAPFRGEIMQVPPMYSALKRDGKKLYELAREGIEVERQARPVTISHLELTQLTPLNLTPLELPEFGLVVKCSGGTYIRSLITDLARHCGTRGHMTGLLRSQQGPFVVSECLRETQWSYDEIVAALVATNARIGLGGLKSAAIFAT